MTFSCPHYEYNTENCTKLKGNCIPGRKGCVLAGKVTMSEALIKKIKELEKSSEEEE
jgi:hypothetical protein